MKLLEIPADRVLEVDCQELKDDSDMYDEEGNLCGGSSVYLLFRRKDTRDLSSLSLVTCMGLSNEIALICRRSEPSLIRDNRL